MAKMLITTFLGLLALLICLSQAADAAGVLPPLTATAPPPLSTARAVSSAGDVGPMDLIPRVYLPIILGRGSRTFPNTTNGIFVFSDQLATSMTEAQFQFAATHYVGAQKMLRSDTRHLRQYNSNFLVLHYRLGQALGYRMPDGACQPAGEYLQIINGDQWVQEWPGSVQENWFFHQSGSRVFNCDYGHYLMELNDPGWRAWWSAQVIAQLQANENDGIFADSYNIPNYGFNWNPALPGVDEPFETAWAEREHAFTDYMRGQFAGRWKWIPNVGAMITSRDPSDYSNVDGVMVEGFVDWGNGAYHPEGDWILEMNNILPLVAADKIVIAQTYPDAASVDERLYVLGSYLLIKGAHTYINMEGDEAPEWFPEYGVALGAPAEALPADIATYHDLTWDVYVRHYARGMVLVNPSDTPRTIALDATYYRVVPSGGGTVPESGLAPGSLSYPAVTSLDLCAQCGAILLNQAP